MQSQQWRIYFDNRFVCRSQDLKQRSLGLRDCAPDLDSGDEHTGELASSRKLRYIDEQEEVMKYAGQYGNPFKKP
jgi:hypothetical protein